MQDIFQRKVNETLGDLTGVARIADDIVVYGCNSDFSDFSDMMKTFVLFSNVPMRQVFVLTWTSASSDVLVFHSLHLCPEMQASIV